MSRAPSSPIQIGIGSGGRRGGARGTTGTSRTRRDTIEAIKNASGSFTGDNVVPGLSASTPPTYVPDGSHKLTKIDKYEILEQVESHNSKHVYKALNTLNNQELICKVYNRCEYGKTMSVYYLVGKHPNINTIADKVILPTKVYAFYTPGQAMPNKPQTEGFKADNLHNFIRCKTRLAEHEAAPLFRQAVKAVAHCHKNNVVLKDLKLRKFIFRDKERKEIMLECIDDAHILEEGDDGKIADDGIVFPAYASPEMVSCVVSSRNDKKKEYSIDGKQRDVWRLGVMLYTMLVGCYPFNNSSDKHVLAKIFHCTYNPIPSHVSKQASDLIKQLLVRNPNNRVTAEAITYHPWLVYQGSSYDNVQPLGRGGDSWHVDEAEQADLMRFSPFTPPASLYQDAYYSDQLVPDIN